MLVACVYRLIFACGEDRGTEGNPKENVSALAANKRPLAHLSITQQYLLPTEFEGRTVSYGPSFSPSIYGPSAKRADHKSKERNEDPSAKRADHKWKEKNEDP